MKFFVAIRNLYDGQPNIYEEFRDFETGKEATDYIENLYRQQGKLGGGGYAILASKLAEILKQGDY